MLDDPEAEVLVDADHPRVGAVVARGDPLALGEVGLEPAEIDALNARIYDGLNNGVYKAGFANSQEAYDEAVEGVFETLGWLEDLLSRREGVRNFV